jgi:DNA-binding PadR family transcriptional regulator
LRVLNYAFKNGLNISPVGKGFIEITKLTDDAREFFISRDAIDDSLSKLANYDLIQFENQSQKNAKDASYFAITSTGRYYLKQLLNRFVYLDLIWMDTPISDNEVYQSLKRKISIPHNDTDIDKLKKRFERVEIFLDYLKQKENQEFILHPEYKDSGLMEKEFIPEIRVKFDEQKSYILSRLAEKNQINQKEDVSRAESN